MRRRDFITLVGRAAVARPLSAFAAQPGRPVVGFLSPLLPEMSTNMLAAFRAGLSEMGFIEDRTVAIEYRWANNDHSRLRSLAADLAHQAVAVIAATGNMSAALAAKEATTTIPIVFNLGTDPVRAGIVLTINKPGGNITGVTTMNSLLGPKWLELMHKLLPNATRFALLVDGAPESTILVSDVRVAVPDGLELEVLQTATMNDIEKALGELEQKRIQAVMIAPGAVFLDHHADLAALTLRHGLPAIYTNRAFAEAGGLMSYGSDFTDSFRQSGVYCGRILKGERASDLPVQQASRFEFVINLKSAKALGVQVPPTLLALTDAVVE